MITTFGWRLSCLYRSQLLPYLCDLCFVPASIVPRHELKKEKRRDEERKRVVDGIAVNVCGV
jgi:hypothetical protein